MERNTRRRNALKESRTGLGKSPVECRVTVDVNAPVREADDLVENLPVTVAPEPIEPTEPYEGMELDSEEAVKTFYYGYAMRVGFGVRANLRRRSMRDGTTIGLQFVCSKEGFRRKKHTSKRAHTRKGCKAMIKAKKIESGKWVVIKFVKEHNHELEAPRKVPLLRSRKRISNAVKNPNYVPSLRRRTLGRDGQYLLDYFKRTQAKNPSFFYAVQLDDEYRMTNFFWVDARSRMSYNHFGDVVTFDTTYRTNRYGMPFAPFIGVNHHKQPVLFGCALILDESEESLVWLFNTWLEAMSGRHPVALVTDQDPVIGSAIAKVFPRTIHRFCKWHILREFKERLGHVDDKHKDFTVDFFKCISLSELTDEFEQCWWSLVDKYELKENEWLQSLNRNREQWVQVYLQDTSISNMSSNLQIGSINSYFDGYVSPHTSLQEFITQYEKAIESRYAKELEEDLKISDIKPMKTGLPMETQAAEIYTRALFLEFQEQLFQSLRHIAELIKEEGPISSYRVVEFGVGKTAYTVTFNVLEVRANCSCQMFEYSGILCRHILRVFSIKNVMLLPPHFIVKRWTRNAMSRVASDEDEIEMQGGCQESRTLRYDDICRQAFKYGAEGATTKNIYTVAMRALRKAFEDVVAAKKDDWAVQQPSNLVSANVHEDPICEGNVNMTNGINLHDPRRRIARGHPPPRSILENQRLHGGLGGDQLGFPDRILGVATNTSLDMYEPTGLFSLDPDSYAQVAHGTSYRDRDTYPH
ncbi:protein FAR1-RELATED SEQUENCE 5-like [Magnolia sinica]|uniref:protein FAR1-RELATED SEQUENCE 5-like n=1 Tax=Magnolia sinica TaxID=86752 RepID=UPI002657AB58|nr:protein FAR1-RELATED SEQUENCE 5-like [Magnolia sinica]